MICRFYFKLLLSNKCRFDFTKKRQNQTKHELLFEQINVVSLKAEILIFMSYLAHISNSYSGYSGYFLRKTLIEAVTNNVQCWDLNRGRRLGQSKRFHWALLI